MCWDAAQARNGIDHASDGTVAPNLTNGQAVQLLRAWLGVTGRAGFPLWYQFGAAAYGWDPVNDKLDKSAKQRDAWFPVDLANELWLGLFRVAIDRDGDNSPTPRLDFSDGFDDPIFQASVKQALTDDGAEAQFKIPFPACKDKDGKPTRPKKNRQGKWECDPLTVDDPLTHAANQLLPWALMLGALWLLTQDDNSVARRRRGR